jgi:hypothetical protein
MTSRWPWPLLDDQEDVDPEYNYDDVEIDDIDDDDDQDEETTTDEEDDEEFNPHGAFFRPTEDIQNFDPYRSLLQNMVPQETASPPSVLFRDTHWERIIDISKYNTSKKVITLMNDLKTDTGIRKIAREAVLSGYYEAARFPNPRRTEERHRLIELAIEMAERQVRLYASDIAIWAKYKLREIKTMIYRNPLSDRTLSTHSYYNQY